MDITQVKSLKLNARNIRSTLISSNKSLKKLRVDESSFLKRQEVNRKRLEKEESIEKPSKIQSSIEFLKSKLASGPMGIFDKIKEFFGLVLMGLLVNNLPGIIKRLQKFFGDNPWIINGLKQIFGYIKTGLSNLINLVASFSTNSYTKTENQRKEIEVMINSLDSLLTGIENSVIGMIGNAIFSPPTPAKPQTRRTTPRSSPANAQRFAQSGGYGRYAPPAARPQPQSNPSRPSREAAPTVKPRVTPGEVKGYARGGTVRPNSGQQTRVSSRSRSPFSKPGGTAQGRKAIKSTESFSEFFTNTRSENSRIKDQEKNNNLFRDLIKKFQELKTLKDDEKGGGGNRRNRSGGPSGGDIPGEVSVSSDSPDFWLLSTVALFENSDPQGAADVAQATYNRVAAPGDPWKTGGSIRTALLAPGQYTPVSNYGGPSAWGKIVDKKTAIEFVQKNGKRKEQLETVSSALLDSSRQSSARTFVGPRDSFRSTTTENKEYDQLANDTEVTRSGHIFGFEPAGAQIGKFRKGELKAAEVNRQTRGTVTPTAPPPKPNADIISEDKTVVVEGRFRLRPDAAAAYKRMKADAKKEGVNITLTSAWRDSSVQAYLYDLFIRGLGNLAAPPGSSDHERGIAIDLASGIPWAQKNCTKYGWYNSGMTFSQKEPWHFDYRGGGLPQPKPQEKPKVKPVLTQTKLNELLERKRRSKPGSGEEIKIPGVGTYVRGTEGVWPLQRPVDKYFDENGNPLTKEEFNNRLQGQITSKGLVSAANIKPKSLERGNIDNVLDEEGSSTVILAQQQVIVPGPVVPMPYGVPQKSSSSTTSVAFSPESLAARSLV